MARCFAFFTLFHLSVTFFSTRKCLFFGICKLITDSSLAYSGFYQLASMFDFKYHSVRLTLMHSVGRHQAVQNSRPTPVLCQIVSSPLVCMG